MKLRFTKHIQGYSSFKDFMKRRYPLAESNRQNYHLFLNEFCLNILLFNTEYGRGE